MQPNNTLQKRINPHFEPPPLTKIVPIHAVMTGLALLACNEQRRLLINQYDGSIHYEDRSFQTVRRYWSDDGAVTLTNAIGAIWRSALHYIKQDHAMSYNLQGLMPSAHQGLQAQILLYVTEDKIDKAARFASLKIWCKKNIPSEESLPPADRAATPPLEISPPPALQIGYHPYFSPFAHLYPGFALRVAQPPKESSPIGEAVSPTLSEGDALERESKEINAFDASEPPTEGELDRMLRTAPEEVDV